MADKEKYEEVERLYDRICGTNADVIKHMKDLIDQHVDNQKEVSSKDAGRAILPKCEAFRQLCGPLAPQVFGVLLRNHLTKGDWYQDKEPDGGGREVTVYRR